MRMHLESLRPHLARRVAAAPLLLLVALCFAGAARAQLTITTLSLPTGMESVPYSTGLQATGGTSATYSWAVLNGTLPIGLQLNSATGVLSGTPAPATFGLYPFTVQLSDGVSSITQPFTLQVAVPGLAITSPSALPNATTGVPYSFQFTAVFGGPPYTWSVVPPAPLPPGLILNANTGLLSGITNAVGNYTFTIQVTTVSGSVQKTFTLVVAPPVVVNPPVISTPAGALPQGAVGAAYTISILASGGNGFIYAWGVTAGTLPPGLTLGGTTGIIAGTPTVWSASAYSFSITVSDSFGSDIRAYSILVPFMPVTITTSAALPNVPQSTSYSKTFTAIGGNGGAYQWTLLSGTLPAGLSFLAPTGVITGTAPLPTAAPVTLVVVASDASGADTKTFTLSVVAATPVPQFIGQPMVTAEADRPYLSTVPIVGAAPITLVLSGAPAWMTVVNGALSGTPGPAQSGVSTISITASNLYGFGVTSSFTLTVAPSRFDTNHSGSISVADVQIAVNIILGLAAPAWQGQADTSGDSRVNSVDIQQIVNRLLNP